MYYSVLIKHGFDVNRVLPGAHGTCLHEAALYGKIEAVHYLLQCGANPSIKNTQGLTPLDIVNHYTDPRSAQQLKQLLKGVVVIIVVIPRPCIACWRDIVVLVTYLFTLTVLCLIL